ncbi:MAG TPA: hypothetical protein VF148_14055 [Acidimicrobiia bacterium]
MRSRVLILGLVTVTACGSWSPIDGATTTSPAGILPTTPTSSTLATIGPIRGALPDGTVYDIAFPTPAAEEVGGIEAGLVVEAGGAEIPLAVEFRRDDGRQTPEVFSRQAGDWIVDIEIPDSLGSNGRDVISDAVTVTTEVDMPVLTLRPPLSWSDPPRVEYDKFIVQSGCPQAAAACNPTHAVSVVPRSGVTLATPISVQSYALRPASDPNYLPPGPLSARWSPDVIWTGEEMVVWGGSADPGPSTLIDGAAFDPGIDEWRRISSPPLTGEQATRAVWAGQEMVVLGEEATVAWHPGGDRWRVVANRIIPPLDVGMTVATGSEIITWTSAGLYRLPAGGDWASMPDPGVGKPGLFDGSVLRIEGSKLIAIGQDGCERIVTRWKDEKWSEPFRISMGAPGPSCGKPNQTSVLDDVLVMWDDTSGEVVSVDPATGETTDEPVLPLPTVEHAPGPLALDDGFLISAGLEAAVFQVEGKGWVTAELPGLGSDVDMLWTGEEVLMWAKCCYGPDDIDAWRWVLPAP